MLGDEMGNGWAIAIYSRGHNHKHQLSQVYNNVSLQYTVYLWSDDVPPLIYSPIVNIYNMLLNSQLPFHYTYTDHFYF